MEITNDLSKFGTRELREAEEIISALTNNKNKTDCFGFEIDLYGVEEEDQIVRNMYKEENNEIANECIEIGQEDNE